MATAVIEKKTADSREELAARYAGSLVHLALVGAGESLKASEVARLVGRDDVDARLARVALATTPSITAVDRKWTVWTRFQDKQNALDANIHGIFEAVGQPLPLRHLARELNLIYGRPAEAYEQIVARLADNSPAYFRIGKDFLAPAAWLLDTDPRQDEEILFENYLEDDDVFPLTDAAQKAGLDPARSETVTAFLNAVGKPVKNKALQFLAFSRLDPDRRERFDPRAFYASVFLDSGAVALPGGVWVGPALAGELAAHFTVLADQEVSDNAEAEAQEAAQPLALGDAERDGLVNTILETEGSTHAARLLEDVFEVTSDLRTYAEDLRTVIAALAADERVLWVGTDRFRAPDTIPPYVFGVPGLLDIPDYDFVDEEGAAVDVLLEDEGFNGGLEREVLNPLAQDVLDEEPVPAADPNPPSTARAVVKYHHKEIGTLPLCQFPSGFFPAEPTVLETEFILPGGQKTQVWVNNETRLLYGLIDWFQSIPIDSGATFTLERQAPDRYVINYNDESEPSMFISRNRLNDLLALLERAETEELPTLNVLREIMEHYRKGIEFLTLHTELNIVRRVKRRLTASLLSEYQYFIPRSGAWVYDAKKLANGFDRSKKKFIAK